MFKKRLLLLICFVTITTFAQKSGTVTGVVKDKNGIGLPGATVLVKGTNNGTQTDFDGKYSITFKSDKAILTFQYLGFKTVEIECKANSEKNVILKESASLLDEILIIGYGTQIKKKVTSSISTIKSNSINEGGNNSIGELLQGKASGLQITNTDATPGAPMRITVRGTNSINAGTEPLWIIDGIPVSSNQENSNLRASGVMDVNNPLANINSDDIETIQILKDAASTSIYGSRGANGVILVTTKSGEIGEIKVNFNVEAGVSKAVNYKTYVNGSQYFEMVEEARQNSGLSAGSFFPSFFEYNNPKYSFFDRSYAETVNTNWLNEVLKPGFYTKYSGSISGGTAGARYFISIFNNNTEGVMVGDNRTDTGISANLNLKLSDKFDLGLNTNFSKSDFQYAQKWGGAANRTNVGIQNWGGRAGWRGINRGSLPVYPIYTPDGDFFDPWGGLNAYPASLPDNQLNDNEQYSARVITSLTYRPIKDLTFDLKAGLTYRTRNQLLFISELIRRKSPDENRGSSRGLSNRDSFTNFTFNGVVNYTKKIKDFDLNFMAGTESYKRKNEVEMGDYEDLQSQQISIGDATSATFLRAEYYKTTDVFASFFGRINGSFKNKYLFGVTLRADGSSVFAPKSRWGNFGSISGGWIISDESFMEKQTLFNLLKLRTSYGSTGNADIPSFKWRNNFQTWAEYGTAPALVPSNIGTDNLTWEKSYTTDVAIDFGLLSNRISGSLGYFHMQTKAMLLEAPIAPSNGIYSQNNGPTALLNVGSMTNRGVEFEISSTNVKTKNFTWKTDFNISTIKNEVGQLAKGVETPLQLNYTPPYGSDLAINSVWTGSRLGRFYIAEYAGLDSEGYQTIYEIDQDKFVDSGFTITEKTGNIVRATVENVQRNRVYHDEKSGLPTFFGGMTNSFSYKNFSLNIIVNFSGGNYIYDQTVNQNGFVNGGRNVINSKVYNNTWLSGVREDARYPIQTWNNLDNQGSALSTEHTAYLYKGDYLRVQNIQLSYKVPKKITKKLNLNYINFYANVTNAFLLSYFKDFDPEFVNYGNIHAANTERNLGQGYIRYDPFPKARTISFGTRISF